MPYGINNAMGMPDERTSLEILSTALDCGVRIFDTARLYGSSEKLIGRFLKANPEIQTEVITKLDSLKGIEEGVGLTEAIDESIRQSQAALDKLTLDVVLIHNPLHLYSKTVLKRLKWALSQGIIVKAGASVYTPSEAKAVLDENDLTVIQIPFNILDWRWREGAIASELKERGIRVFVRSVFLQGLLVAPFDRWPQIPGVNEFQLFTVLQNISRELERPLPELLIAYVRSFDWIESIVVGAETIDQVREISRLTGLPALNRSEREYCENQIGKVPIEALTPASWRIRS